MIHQS